MTEEPQTGTMAGIGPEVQAPQSVESQLAALEEKLSQCGDNWRLGQRVTATIEQLKKSSAR